MKAKQMIERTLKQRAKDFLKTGKCFNDACSNKTAYTKHGVRKNKWSTINLVKCSVCNTVFGVPQDYV